MSHISDFDKLKLCTMFFGRFLCQLNYDRKKRYSHLPSVGMFGGSMSSDCFGGFLDQITAKKKGTVVWPLVAMFGGFHELGLFWWVRHYVFGGFLDQTTNYDWKKGTVVWPSVGMFTMYF
jgi:hypothetical protein